MDKIFVTGVTGFIGKRLLEKLPHDEYEIHILERYVTGRYSFEQERDVVKHTANLADYPSIRNIIKEIRPDYVVHLASISPLSFSYDRYIEVTETNYNATINLAETCYKESPEIKQFIFAGSSEVYGMALKDTKNKLSETTPPMPNSPYAVAKHASENYLRYMGMAYNFPYTILRPFNTYGRTENRHFFIERVISQMLKQDNVHLGSADAVRDWLYVDDHVEGYLKALGNKNAIGETINVCTGKGYTTKETAELIGGMLDFKGNIVWNSTPKRPLDAQYLIGDNTKAAKLLGWKPKYMLEGGLKKTISYWRETLKGERSSNGIK